MFCAALGALVASSCSNKLEGFVSLGSDVGGAAGGRGTGDTTNEISSGGNHGSGGLTTTDNVFVR